MAKWNEYRIGDLCSTISETYKGDDDEVILINTSDVLEGKILNHEMVPNKKLKGQFKKTFKTDDILYSEIRPANKRFAYVDIEDTSLYIASTKLMILRPNTSIVEPRFLFAILSSQIIIDELQVRAESRSGTFPQITYGAELSPMKVMIPDKYTQKKIVSFLNCIQGKLDINEAINRNLLEQAISVFKEKIWSKDKNGTIGDYCIMKSGFAFKSSWWTDEGVKVIKIGDINQDNLSLSTCSHVDEDKVEKAGDFSVKAGDLVLAMTGATIGKFAMVPERSETILVNQRVGKFFLGEEPLKKVPFIYCTLKMDDVYSEVIGRGQGSAQPNISANDVMTIPCVIPTDIEIDEFNEFAEPIFASIVKNQNENEKLANLRDSLLPKLMSGELDVSNLDI